MISENDLYDDLLASIADFDGSHCDNLVATNAKRGVSSIGDLMVVGRALNGWDKPFQSKHLRTERCRAKEVKKILRHRGFERRCPLEWIANEWGNTGDYNPARSAFWRVAWATSSSLNFDWVDAEDWSSHLMWSNLYKVSPDLLNPGSRLCRAQLSACQKILDFELEQFRPSRVLLLTGLDWAWDFLTDPRFIKSRGRSGRVEWSGTWSKDRRSRRIAVVVCPHPQGKPEDPIVRDAVRSFRRLEETGL